MSAQASLTQFLADQFFDRNYNWYVFRVFNFYRLILSTILLAVFFLNPEIRFLGEDSPGLFQWTATAYVALSLIGLVASILRYPSLLIQSHIQILIDIAALITLSHASGGLNSNLVILLVISLAASGILLPWFSVLLTALLASLAITASWLESLWKPITIIVGDGRLTMQRFNQVLDYLAVQTDDLGRVGILIAAFFIAGLTTYALSERARRSETLARQRTQEILELVRLNQAIVQHLQSGIIVVDGYARIRLMNNTACDLLDCTAPKQGAPLADISPVLSQRLAGWLSGSTLAPKPFRQSAHLPDITPNFSVLNMEEDANTLIFLEDSSQVTQRLQQIKLAALGRLTASIAHEIRNPLTSISHAAQLLNESTTSNNADRRLGQIVHDSARRANKIISNVLDMSRRDIAKPEELVLTAWLADLKEEFLASYSGTPTPHIVILVQPPDLAILFDPGHLRQVIWNLINNACFHGSEAGDVPNIRVIANRDSSRTAPVLDVIDSGKGISDTDSERIFEPFFTTKTQGTGLGLYISREICEANRAQLQYIRPASGGSCFRITFANVEHRKELKIQWRQETL